MKILNKYKFSFSLAFLLLAGAACTKKNLEYEYVAPISSYATTMSLINNAWKLSQYIIIADKQEYIFTANDFAGLPLKSLEFSYPVNYVASDTSWSGVYSFSNDSTMIYLKPINPSHVELILGIDQLSQQVMILSSAVVNCSQQIPELSDFEKFVAIQSKKWLHTHGIHVPEIKSIKIKFIYSSR